MSLVKSLAKVAIGVAVAKGLSNMMKRGPGTPGGGTQGGLGGIMDQLKRGAGTPGAPGAPGGELRGGGGGLGGILDQLQNAPGTQSGGAGAPLDRMAGQQGGLGGILGQLQQPGGGGLGDMLGRMGQGGGTLGGLGGLLGGLATARSGNPNAGRSLEDLLSTDNPVEEPEAESTAGLMIRAMIFAARCDGQIDDAEKEVIMSTIGSDATPQDMDLVETAMSDPVSAKALAEETPQGVETQVYSMSVMAIEPDNRDEAAYLHELASALGIGQATVNEIHDSFGVPRLYS